MRRRRGVVNDLTGKVIGKWTVLRRGENYNYGPDNKSQVIRYWCRCACGFEALKAYSQLTNPSRKELDKPGRSNSTGYSRRCRGCAKRSGEIRRNNLSSYAFWMKHRHKENTHPEWKEDAEVFLNYTNYIPKKPQGKYLLTLIDHSLGLVPGNIVWAPKLEVMNNGERKGQVLITIDGVTKTMTGWARKEGVTRQAIEIRILKGCWRNNDRVKVVKVGSPSGKRWRKT